MNDLRNTPLGQLLFLSALMGGASLVEDTATGNPVTFETDLARPLKSLIANFLPIQSGTGDPSPTNIRPITGWTGLDVWHGGKNVLSGVVKNLKNIAQSNGTFTNTATDTRSNPQIRIEAYNGNTYLGQFANKSPSEPKIISAVLDTTSYPTMNRLMITHYGLSKDFEVLFEWTLPKGKYTLQFNLTGADVQTVGGFSFDSVMVEVGEVTPSTYEPYTGSTLPVTWSTHGTIYGGYVDLVTGEVWATWNGIQKKWSEGNNTTDVGEGITRKMFPMVDNLQTGQAKNLCNVAPYNASENANTHYYYSGSGSTNNARVFLPTETDGNTDIVIITNVSVPILITTLTPQQINALKGNNTVWSDANSDCEVTYLKKG